jgi:hypothetical protein
MPLQYKHLRRRAEGYNAVLFETQEFVAQGIKTSSGI